MKLFLASSFDQSVLSFKKIFGSRKGWEVIFIANASDTHKGDTWWVNTDRQAFIKLGCKVIDTDLRTVSKKDFKKLLGTSSIIHFCGGSVLYLINLLRERGFDKLVTSFVRNDKLIYTGTSAGSMIAAEDLKLSYFDPEEKEYINVEKIKDFSGLKLVNFLIIPHTNNKDFTEGNSKMMSDVTNIKSKQPLIFIYDGQAVLVEDGNVKII
jgi:peptidase E